MRHLLLIILITLALLNGCSYEQPFICQNPSECSGVPHVECDGEWICLEGICVWQCSQAEILEPNVEAVLGELIEIDTIEEELKFSELESLEQELAVLDSW